MLQLIHRFKNGDEERGCVKSIIDREEIAVRRIVKKETKWRWQNLDNDGRW
jgi:hypothetical protein